MKRIPGHANLVGLEGVEISHSEHNVSCVDILMNIMRGCTPARRSDWTGGQAGG